MQRHILRAGLCAGALLLAAGCARRGSDKSAELASVGGQKITENRLRLELEAKGLSADQMKTFDAAPVAQKAGLVEQLALEKSLIQYGKIQGLDQDAKVQAQLEAAQASVYYRALLDRRMGTPADADLKALYEEQLNQAKAQGQDKGFPTLEEVMSNPNIKGSLTQLWKQKQQEKASEALKTEMKARIKTTYAKGYEPPANS